MALKPARFVQLLVLLILAILFYAEFVRDVDTQPALEYYRQLPQIVDADNAAFAFAGLAAPPGTADPRSWGFVEVMKNRERLRRGEARIRVLDDRDAGDG